MTTIMRYDPFRETLSLRRAMDQLFEQSFIHPSSMSGSSSLMAPMDVCETQNGYEVDVALPGVRPEDIELTVEQNTLTIRGHYSHQNEHQDQKQNQQTSHAQEQGESVQQQPQQGEGGVVIVMGTPGSRGKSFRARLNGRSAFPSRLIPTLSNQPFSMGC